MSKAIEINNLSFKPDQNKFFESDNNNSILRNINLDIEHGTIFGITGESGSGKTTLAKLIAGLLIPSEGDIALHGGKNDKGVQFLFQNNDELINPLRSVKDILHEASIPDDRINEVCALVDIHENHFGKKGYQLSGGERQRVGLARILLADPQVLILDEPFSAQDPGSTQNLLRVLKKISHEFSLTIICISHDIQTLFKLCSNIAILYGGKIVEKGPTEEILNNAKHPYTIFLISALKYSLSRKSFGETDYINQVDYACTYYERCNLKTKKCIEEVDKSETGKQITYCNYPI